MLLVAKGAAEAGEGVEAGAGPGGGEGVGAASAAKINKEKWHI